MNVLEAVYDGWPAAARAYVEGNVCQYAAQCDRPYYEAECVPAR